MRNFVLCRKSYSFFCEIRIALQEVLISHKIIMWNIFKMASESYSLSVPNSWVNQTCLSGNKRRDWNSMLEFSIVIIIVSGSKCRASKGETTKCNFKDMARASSNLNGAL
jgi:hypothetical protein